MVVAQSAHKTTRKRRLTHCGFEDSKEEAGSNQTLEVFGGSHGGDNNTPEEDVKEHYAEG